MDHRDNLTAMLLFARVVERQSFSEAARSLHLSKSHVSREIARLEVRLGMKLLQRTTRKVVLTELGQAYYPFCTRLLAEMHRADAFVQQVHHLPAGNVRLQAPVTFGCQCVVPALNAFLHRHIHINVDLELSSSDDPQPDADVAIVIRTRAPEAENYRELSSIDWGLYATPDYLAAHPPIDHPERLSRHDLLLFHGPAHTAALPFRRDKQRLALDVHSRFRANNSMALLNAALAGTGIAYLPAYMTQDALARGEIQQVLPEWQMDRLHSYLLLKALPQPSSPITLLCDALVKALGKP
ncbi:LysR family transcriptional regulator [Pantoea sp. Mb-10]|uniref:LysR family transcriptional regulator n=1 Tax=unclassified Pantoea TaxID=2630326 RepID=UPI001E5BB295|nr:MULTISPECIES: LysR family transcriptional regulator [unclassified Pantoea]MCE0490268.1 LysR family transcriptional regulator [Pantoea sp. Mb-10]MCE0501399.1 LysR family transcriptional regulator [Pantoea sp. Pb-8]